MIDLIFYLEYAEMQRLSGHYQCGYVLHIFMVVQNYCLLNRYKIHHSLCRDRRSKQKAEKDFLQAREEGGTQQKQRQPLLSAAK